MTDTPVRLPYTLTLTAEEYRALAWLEARGYSADLIRHTTDVETADDDGAPVTLRYRESDAWQVHDKAHESHCETCGAALDWSGRPFAGEACRDGADHAPTSNGELDGDFGACAGPALRAKMYAFLDGIV